MTMKLVIACLASVMPRSVAQRFHCSRDRPRLSHRAETSLIALEHAMGFSRTIFILLALQLTAPGVDAADAADALTRLDTNQNHLLEEAEAQAGGRKLFAELDKSGDGVLQLEELNGRLGAAVLKAADPDADGALNQQEYAGC